MGAVGTESRFPGPPTRADCAAGRSDADADAATACADCAAGRYAEAPRAVAVLVAPDESVIKC